MFLVLYICVINAVISYTICCCIKNKFGDHCTEKKFGNHFTEKTFGDQNSFFSDHFAVKNFGDQKNTDLLCRLTKNIYR
jgi:hypothetical protein